MLFLCRKLESEQQQQRWRSIHLGYCWLDRFEPTETETSSAGLLSPKFNVLTESNEAGSEICATDDDDDGHVDSTMCDPRRPVKINCTFAVSDETIT